MGIETIYNNVSSNEINSSEHLTRNSFLIKSDIQPENVNLISNHKIPIKIENFDQRRILHIGIIDYLQEFNFKKAVELKTKSIF